MSRVLFEAHPLSRMRSLPRVPQALQAIDSRSVIATVGGYSTFVPPLSYLTTYKMQARFLARQCCPTPLNRLTDLSPFAQPTALPTPAMQGELGWIQNGACIRSQDTYNTIVCPVGCGAPRARPPRETRK